MNYSDSMYGFNGIILSHPETGYIEFKAEDLLLPRGSEIARIILNSNALAHYSELPVLLLEAVIKGSESEEKAYFALPLSVIGLKIFGSSVAVLVGQQDDETIKSRVSAEYDPEVRDLIVYLTLNTEDGKTKNVVVVYSVKADKTIMNSDILLWPNFISTQWNKYYMYNEMPSGGSSIDYNAVPFVGEQMEGKFLPITDENNNPYYLTQDTEVLKRKGINSMLLVTSDYRVADSPYKYEIYQSDKPFAGVKLVSGTDYAGNEKMAGFLLIRYAPEGMGGTMMPENMMEHRVIFNNRGVHLGFDFGSANSSVAYYDLNDDNLQPQGFVFKNRRISLFGSDSGDGCYQPKDFFFFSKKPTQSNALKSVLALHDPRRLPKGSGLFSELPVAGGLPCFMSNVPMTAVTDNAIILDFGNGVEATLIKSMKCGNSAVDKAHKMAYLRTVLLMVYAELFKKGLKPERLNWSYPSTMEHFTVLNHYHPIWQGLGGTNVSPILDYGEVIPLTVTDISGHHSSLGGLDFGGAIGFDGNINTIGSDVDWLLFPGVNDKVEDKSVNLVPDDPSRRLDFHPVYTTFPMTVSEASANYIVQRANYRRKLVYCINVGDSNTEFSVLYSLANYIPSMIKQSSIPFTAQKISEVVREMPDEFREVLVWVCNKYDLRLIGFNVGPSRYNANTAPYYYEQIVDILDTDQLKYFYSCIAERCPRLFAANLYVTGLIMFYAGQLSRPLLKVINANRVPGSAEVDGFEFVFEGKGARVFDWLCTQDMRMAETYFKAMFRGGAQLPHLPDDRINLSQVRFGKENSDVKFEVSKGLVLENDGLMIPAESFEIFGENGFRGYADDGMVYEYTFDTILTPALMGEIGAHVRQLRADCDCFKQFLSIFGGVAQGILGIKLDIDEMRNGAEFMNIEQYITQEESRFKDAMARSRDLNLPFNYVAPIILIEGLKFYDRHLFKCFK